MPSAQAASAIRQRRAGTGSALRSPASRRPVKEAMMATNTEATTIIGS
jgi:hypothetical protein